MMKFLTKKWYNIKLKLTTAELADSLEGSFVSSFGFLLTTGGGALSTTGAAVGFVSFFSGRYRTGLLLITAAPTAEAWFPLAGVLLAVVEKLVFVAGAAALTPAPARWSCVGKNRVEGGPPSRGCCWFWLWLNEPVEPLGRIVLGLSMEGMLGLEVLKTSASNLMCQNSTSCFSQ